jgi:hypothetical protein
MKQVIYLIFMFFTFHLEAQTLGRLTFSSGGGSANSQLPCSFGEAFGGTATGGGITLTVGSQQGTIAGPNAIHLIDADYNKIVVFPVPSSDKISVEMRGKYQNNFQVRVTDISGRTLITKSRIQVHTDIELQDLSPGSYQISIYNPENKNIFNQTILKQ